MIRIISKGLIVLFAVLLALLSAEIYLRTAYPQSTIDNVLSFYNYSCYQALPYYFIGLKPNSNCTFASNDESFEPFTVRVNSLGLRGDEVLTTKPENKTRILFVGDSYTFGLGVKEENTFSSVVKKLLNQKIKDKGFETLNAGVPATGPGYDYLFIKNTGLSLKPDVIIVGFYMQNDIPDMISHHWNKDKYGLPTKIVSKSVHVEQGKLLPINTPLKYSVPILKHSHLFSLLTDLLPTEYTDPTIRNDEATKQDLIITPETCLYKYNCHTLDELKKDTKKVYLEMKKLADKNNIKFIVVHIPAPYQITPKSNLFTFNIPIPLLPKEKNYPYDEFNSFFKKNNIDYIDPRKELREYKEDLYYLRDNHFNAAGHKAIAKIISDNLIEYFNPTASASTSAKKIN